MAEEERELGEFFTFGIWRLSKFFIFGIWGISETFEHVHLEMLLPKSAYAYNPFNEKYLHLDEHSTNDV